MEGFNFSHAALLRELDENWSLPDRRRTQRNASLFLRRDLNDQALRTPPALSFTQIELDQAREEAFEAGRQAGQAAAAASREAAEAAALEGLAGLLADAREASAAAADRAGGALARALVGALDAVMPDLVRRSAMDEWAAMLALVLPGLSREPAIAVEVPAGMEAGVGALIGRLDPEISDRVTVTARASLAAGELRVRWSAGQAQRMPAVVWKTVMDRLEPALPAPAGPSAAENNDGN